MKALVLVISLFWISLAQASDYTRQCQSLNGPVSGTYCVHKPNQNASGDIVYYLHGLSGNELRWAANVSYNEQVREEWTSRGSPLPIVVSISFGPIWLLAEKNSSTTSGLFEFVSQVLIPKIEKGLGGLKGRRLIYGESMGGFNSVQLALKTNLFEKAAVICSPMATVSPFASQKDVDAYVQSSRAWSYYKDSEPDLVQNRVSDSIQLAKAFFPTLKDWLKADPLRLANTSPSQTKLYVTVGFFDPYVNYEGNQKFVTNLEARGIYVDWRPEWGGHCAVDIQSLAKFLVE